MHVYQINNTKKCMNIKLMIVIDNSVNNLHYLCSKYKFLIVVHVHVLRTRMHEITFNIVEHTCLSASIMLTNVPIQRITVMVSPLIFNVIVTVTPVILRMVNPWITSVVTVGTHDFTWTTLEHVS